MAIFVVMTVGDGVDLQSRIAKLYPNDHLHLTTGQWLVAADMTAKELSEKLGVVDGSAGRVLVAAISSYYGRHAANVWEWIKVKWEGGPHGR
jgi:hypothetical protein